MVFSLYQYGGGSLRSESLNETVTPLVCYLQTEIDAKIAEKTSLESPDKKSIPEIQDALAKISPTTLSDEALTTEKKQIDEL